MALFCAFFVVACGFDYCKRRIPNWLIILIILNGFCFRFDRYGPMGIFLFSGQAVAVFLFFYFLFRIGAFGAGDVKVFEDINMMDKKTATQEVVDDFWNDEPEKPKNCEQKEEMLISPKEEPETKKYLFGLFDNKKKKNKEARERYRKEMHEKMYEYAVAEDSSYEEEYGRTIYIDTIPPEKQKHRIHTEAGRTLTVLEDAEVTIGKKKGEADIILEDASVSRLHARILKEDTKYYVEDLNSTNGTYKNGLRLQPYERRQLEEGDEITVGRVMLRFD